MWVLITELDHMYVFLSVENTKVEYCAMSTTLGIYLIVFILFKLFHEWNHNKSYPIIELHIYDISDLVTSTLPWYKDVKWKSIVDS